LSERVQAAAEALVAAAVPPVAEEDREDVIALLAQLLAGAERL
jgi:hypothetical protein